MIKSKIGLLPLYIELYDRSDPEKKAEFTGYLKGIVKEIEKRDIEVAVAPICRVKEEFAAAVKMFEVRDVDSVVTLHLAYSPSLESAEVLASTKLPLIILDTTPAFTFGPDQNPDEIFFNHGIHGVQDLCNLLIRNKKEFRIETGHWEKSDVLDRIAGWAHAAALAGRFKKARVGRLGRSFKGMGDFCVPDDKLKSLTGITTVQGDFETISRLSGSIDDDLVKAEISYDNARFYVQNVNEKAHQETVKISLGVRQWIEEEKLTAFTLNFLDFDRSTGVNTVPFMEACKAMARGIGYAGEGDTLTAALVGALLSVYPDTTFTEMFCPDWENNMIFISHMAEMNINLAAGKVKLIEMGDYNYSDADKPVVNAGRFRGGRAVLVNLAPGKDDGFSLIIVPVNVMDCGAEDKFEDTVHGWFKPSMPIQEFLKSYSLAGGTHHSALIYGDVASEIMKFGEIMSWKVVTIG